jgi:hypothetical protein
MQHKRIEIREIKQEQTIEKSTSTLLFWEIKLAKLNLFVSACCLVGASRSGGLRQGRGNEQKRRP